METDPIEKYKQLANQLAELINSKKIVLYHYKDYFRTSLINHIMTYSLKGMKECLAIFHQIELHQDSNIKLECGVAHCIECYYFFSHDDYYNKDNFYCTCSTKIVPKFRRFIMDNYIRLQGLKVTCVICYSKKDIMNFSALSTHKTCAVCYTCIEAKYRYEKGIKNSCVYCGAMYNDDSEFAIRALYEQKLSVDVVRNFYLEDCDDCREKKDSRDFYEVCEDKHKICKQCVEEKKKKKAENCFCGLQITYH